MDETKQLTKVDKALIELLLWATGPNRSGNPYCQSAVRKAIEAAKEAYGVDMWDDTSTPSPRERFTEMTNG